MSAIRIGAPPRSLEAVVSRPAGVVRGAAVVCHPHPQMGGDMDSPVVLAIAAALGREGHAVLRFNFGGVGASEGEYSGGPAEVEDVRAALAAADALAPPGSSRLLAGYSFGAWAALRAAAAGAAVERVIAVGPPLAFLDWDFLATLERPVVFVAGERDPSCPAARLLAAATAEGRRIELVEGADHFFADAGEALAGAVASAVRRP